MAEKDSSLLKQMKTLKDTQDDIQGMSTWCLSKGLSIAPKIISTWSRAFKEAEKGSHRVSLFYLANDIVQHAKRRKIKEFVEGWNKVLVFAMPLVRTDPEVCRKVKRVLNIWKEREIYEANFIRSLEDIIDQKSESEPIDFEESVKTYRFSEFATQCAKVVSSSERTERAKKAFEATKLNFSKVLEMREKFKEYKPGDPRITEFYASVSALREYCSSLKSEREDKLRMIRIAEIGNYFYSRTRREAKVVTKAYKNFENRLKDIHEKVMECEGTLPSPVPSPEPNAPSPVDSEPEEVPVKSVIASKFGGNGMLSSVVSVVQKEPYSSRRSV
ncbi:unnamed protein product, partial [Notodromas monacha]